VVFRKNRYYFHGKSRLNPGSQGASTCSTGLAGQLFWQEGIMEVLNWKDAEDVEIKKFPYRGRQNDVKGISIRWLSKHGEDGNGYPEYGLRFFTAQPGGEIPIHNHFYHQTMYILNGRFECYQYEPQSEEVVKKIVCGSGDVIYIPSLEPHGMKNMSDTETATFLCCICNVYDQEDN